MDAVSIYSLQAYTINPEIVLPFLGSLKEKNEDSFSFWVRRDRLKNSTPGSTISRFTVFYYFLHGIVQQSFYNYFIV
jgi:hypothetical protein